MPRHRPFSPYRVGLGETPSRDDFLDRYSLICHVDALRALAAAAAYRRSAAAYWAAGDKISAATAVRLTRIQLVAARRYAGSARRAGFRLPGTVTSVAVATGLVVTLEAA